jgi:hypothetical protein
MRPIIAVEPILSFAIDDLKPTARITFGNGLIEDHQKFRSLTAVWRAYQKYRPVDPPGTYGRLCGPMFMGIEASCFPRGDYVTMLAFACRCALKPPCHPYVSLNPPELETFEEVYIALAHIAMLLFPNLLTRVTPWTRQQVLDHQRVTAKRLQLERCYRDIDNGEMVGVSAMVRCKSFVKGEKHTAAELGDFLVTRKSKMVPRCINAVHPQLNAVLAPVTLPMSKLLNAVFHSRSNVFYAAGATPSQINDFMNNAISHNRYVLEDDVSMADGSHSKGSFAFQDFFVDAQVTDELCLTLIRAMRLANVRVGRLRAFASYINVSGVPLTSWSNTIVFIFVRLYALYVAYDLPLYLEDSTLLHAMSQLMSSIYMAVAGDDGATFLPPSYNGIVTNTPEFLARYSQTWALFGFSVASDKIRVFDPSNWRLSTFLAMRPVWSGQRYEYGPELARRMKTMFWQYDNHMHPVAWARGIASSMLTAARHVPVLSDVCRWLLARTNGAIAQVEFTNPYSTFYGYYVEGDICDRGLNEFLLDYDISRAEYDDFLLLLQRTQDIYVNLSHIVLHKIFHKE